MNTARLSLRQQLTLNVLWFSLNVQSAALLPIVIPTQILLFVAPGQVGNAQQAAFLGLLTTATSTVSLFMPPIVGMLCDHTPGVFGRRRPYIAIGGLLLLISTPFLANASTIIVFLVGLSLLHLGRNILTPAYQSLVPDNVPVAQRGEASGYVGAMTILGNVASLGLAAWLLGGINQYSYNQSVIRDNAGIYYVVAAIAMVIALLITVIGVHDASLLPRMRTIHETGEKITSRFTRWFVHGL